MGHAVVALATVSNQVQKNPLFIPLFGVLAGVFGFLNTIISQIPLLGWIASGIVFGPAIQAGMVAIAATMYNRAEFSLDVFVPSVKQHWVSLVGARLIGGIVFLLIVFFVAIVALLGTGLSAGAMEALSTGPAAATEAIGATSLLLLAFTVAVALVWYAVFQFVGVAIILNGVGAVGSFQQAIQVCVSQPVSVIGYSVLNPLVVFLPVVLGAAPLGAIGFFVDGFQPGVVTAIFGGLGGVVGYTAGSALSAVYHVSFFSRVSSSLGLEGASRSVIPSEQ